MLTTYDSIQSSSTYTVANLRKPLDTMKSELCAIICAHAHFSVH